ncbi:hypothetical protein BDW75DRAFT_244546 [Aspergillus navahoensis]
MDMECEGNQRVKQPTARSWSRAMDWVVGLLQWLYKNVVENTFKLLLVVADINMILLFVGKYKVIDRATIDYLMYTSNALALAYFVLVGIVLRTLGPPARKAVSDSVDLRWRFTDLEEGGQVEPHRQWERCMFLVMLVLSAGVIIPIYVLGRADLLLERYAVWLIWILLVAICVEAWGMGKTVELLASVLSSKKVANLYFISFGQVIFSNSIDGIFMFEAYFQKKYTLAVNNVWLNIAIMLTGLGLLSVYATVLRACGKAGKHTTQPNDAEGQVPVSALWFYQIKGDCWAKGILFILLISVLIIIALGTDAYSDMGTEVFESFGLWWGSFFENFLAPAMCIIPEKAAFLVQITKDPQGAMGQVVEGIKESASQIGLLFWFLLLAFMLKQGHQADLYDNPWPALMAFVMSFLVQVVRLEDNKLWKGLLVSLVGLAMLFSGVYRGYLVGADLTWAESF